MALGVKKFVASVGIFIGKLKKKLYIFMLTKSASFAQVSPTH